IVASAGIGGAGVIARDVESVGTGIEATVGTGIAFAVARDVTTTDAAADGIYVGAGGIAVGHSHGHVQTSGDDAHGVHVVATPMSGVGTISDLIGDFAGGLSDTFSGLTG